jgi:small subunit ribosomal protein S1
VELGEGIRGTCGAGTGRAGVIAEESSAPQATAPDLSSLTSLLQSRWKGNAPTASSKPEPLSAGQIRSFKIISLNADSKKIEVALA